MLRLENVSHSFKNGSEVLKVLHNIEFEVKAGEMIALLGSSGSGKSTLLNLMAGLMKPTEGHIYIAGQDIVKYNENKLAVFRRKHIGFIFQAYELIPTLTVQENVELPLVFQSVPRSKRRKKAMELLEITGIGDKAEMYPSQLSGGQQQRVSIARSLITEPSVIFADEPTGNLDTRTEEEILRIMMTLNQSMNTTFVIVTHEMEVAAQMKKTIMLRDGYLVTPGEESGPEAQRRPEAIAPVAPKEPAAHQLEVVAPTASEEPAMHEPEVVAPTASEEPAEPEVIAPTASKEQDVHQPNVAASAVIEEPAARQPEVVVPAVPEEPAAPDTADAAQELQAVPSGPEKAGDES